MAQHKVISSLMRPFFRKGREASFTVPGAIGANSRILCIDSGDLCDLVYHIPLLTAIRRHYPKARMDFLLPESHAPLVVPSGLAQHCIIYRKRQLNPWRPAFSSLLRKLGAGEYDVALVMSYSPQPRLELAALASGAGFRYGPSHPDSWPAINFEIQQVAGGTSYLGDRLRRAAPFFGFAPEEMVGRWPLPMDRLRQMAQQVHFHKPNPDQMLIAVDPGTSKTGRAFALDNILFLVRQLSSQLACTILPLADPAEKERLDEFEARLSGVPVGLPRETLMDMVLLLAQCDLYVGANTDLFHFAVAQGIPSIGLFGKHDAAHWVPVDRPRARVIRITKGEKVDIETLMEAVESVTEGRTSRISTIITEAELEAGATESGQDGTAGDA